MKKMQGRERHHRHPVSQKGSYLGKNIHEERNISLLRPEYHRAYHLIFGNLLPEEVAALLTEVYISPDYYMVAIPRKKKRTKRRSQRYCVDCQAVVLKHIKKNVRGHS